MIPTAAKLFDKMLEENDECTSTEMMIEFAKMHVQAALKAADEQAEHLLPEGCWDLLEDVNFLLNSYPESNVK
jgi:hypothetical protein